MMIAERLRLRPIRRDDLPILRAWFDDPETMRYWGHPSPLVVENAFEGDLNGRFARFDDAGHFMIELLDGTPIGRIGYEELDPQTRSARVLILIGVPEARGQGYGTEAMAALVRYLFYQRNLHRISLAVYAWNERAIRSYEKVGFVAEGRLREDQFFDGRYHDSIVMSILRDEFDERWAERDPALEVPVSST